MSSPSFVVLGAGSRGQGFSDWLRTNVGPGSVVAVADPRPERRRKVAEQHGIPESAQFETWQQLLEQPKLAEAAINTTMDREHVGSAVAAMRKGYHMLLEKPMATELEHCIEIDRVRRETERIVSVCHSLRYHAVYADLRELLRSGIIGEIVSIDQLEAVEHIHQSHSFVRGNWGNSCRATFMLMAKSCHYIDIIADMAGRDCVRANSYGKLTYFTRENMPEGAPAFCLQGCPAAPICPYHAEKIYVTGKGWFGYAVGLDSLDEDGRREALLSSPYGRCVFQTDNDVVDHQVVAMEFEGGLTATFTMTAFHPHGGRYVRVHGTKGYIEARVDQRTIDIWEFWRANRHTHIDVPREDGGHGGADSAVMRSLLAALESGDPSKVLTSTAESLRTHKIVFAAERSRVEGRAVSLSELD